MSKDIYRNRAHSLTISNTLNEKGSPIKRKIIAQYMPKFQKKLKLSNKKVLSASQDRLSQLTTKQIDRLIEMQKIKSLLNDNKKGIRATHINFTEHEHNHPNVYQPNFLAKINRIAVQRNIHHLRSQQFDEATLSPKQLRQKGLQLQKRNLKFIKEYKIDCKKKTKVTYQQAQEKSISNIQDNVEEFEQTLQSKKNQTAQKNQNLNKFRHKDTNILSMTRWFNGMSTFYLDLKGHGRNRLGGSMQIQHKNNNEHQFDRNFDFQYEKSYQATRNTSKNQTKSKFYNTRISTVY